MLLVWFPTSKYSQVLQRSTSVGFTPPGLVLNLMELRRTGSGAPWEGRRRRCARWLQNVSEGTPIRLGALLCALALLVSGTRAGQARPDFPENPRFSVLRFEDRQGMDAVTATSLGQDAQGFLWIATQTGLYRFDGTRAKKMTEADSLIGHYVVDMVIAPDGTPWFAGNRGIAFYKDGEFTRVPIPESSMALLSGVQISPWTARGRFTS